MGLNLMGQEKNNFFCCSSHSATCFRTSALLFLLPLQAPLLLESSFKGKHLHSSRGHKIKPADYSPFQFLLQSHHFLLQSLHFLPFHLNKIFIAVEVPKQKYRAPFAR